MCIEHPDHTGESANPDAPWNAPDAEPWTCPSCDAQHDDDTAREECWVCGAVLCETCSEWWDGEVRCHDHANDTHKPEHPLGYADRSGE